VAPQKADLVVGKLEHEVSRETLDIALDRAIERLDRYSVKRREIAVEQDLLSAQNKDGVFDALRWHKDLLNHSFHSFRSRSQIVTSKPSPSPPYPTPKFGGAAVDPPICGGARLPAMGA
jgi:hypothetical protein